MKDEALNNSLADTPQEKKAKTIGDKMGDVKAKPLIETLPHSLPPATAKTNFDKLGHVRAEALNYTIAETLQEAKDKTHLETLHHLET